MKRLSLLEMIMPTLCKWIVHVSKNLEWIWWNVKRIEKGMRSMAWRTLIDKDFSKLHKVTLLSEK